MRTRYLPDGWTPIVLRKEGGDTQVIGRNEEGEEYTFIFNRNLDFACVIASWHHIHHDLFEN